MERRGCHVRLYRYPLKNVGLGVRVAVGIAWLTSISIIAFIPVDLWATLNKENVHPIYVMWEISFWLNRSVSGSAVVPATLSRSTQFLTWVGIPLYMGYVDSGAFSHLGK